MDKASEEGLLNISPTKVVQQSATKIISVTIMNLVTPKAGAKHDLLFNKMASVVYFVPMLQSD